MTTKETPTEPQREDVPEAVILPPRKRSFSSASVAVFIPIMAILFAAWYGVRAWDQRGLEIDIHFADGHGIKAGDSLRFHGISVGQVKSVTLDRKLEGVDVQVQLMESSRALAKTGSRYWIVRPRVEFAGITGLDTVLGAHYLNVSPGPKDAAPRQSFTGLEEPPVDVAPGSLELVLEATERGSARRGSPVTWRRTPVGQVLSAELSSDARVVEVRIAIRPEYASLVLENSRFFEVGGLSLDVGIGGMQLEVESLEALLSGGVAFATPDKGGKAATANARFTLYGEPKEEWLEWRPALAIGTAAQTGDSALLPIRGKLSWEEGMFNRNKDRKGWMLLLEAGLLGPADLLGKPEDAGDEVELDVLGETISIERDLADHELAVLALTAAPAGAPLPWPKSRLRGATVPEDCIATGDPEKAPTALAASHLSGDTMPWIVKDLEVGESWHGAVVTSRATGDVVGILIVTEDEVRVAPLPAALLP